MRITTAAFAMFLAVAPAEPGAAQIPTQASATKKSDHASKAPKIFKYSPGPGFHLPEGVSENIEVEETKDDLKVTTLPGGREVRYRYIFPLGSRQIRIKINPEVGYTTVADLRFKANCVINIGTDGMIEVDRAGVRADMAEETPYISRRVVVAGKPVVVMVEDEIAPGKPDERLALKGTLVDRRGAPVAGKKVCLLTTTADGRMVMPLNLKGGRLNEASAVSDAKGTFTILTDKFTEMKLALCKDETNQYGVKVPKPGKTLLEKIVAPKGQRAVNLGKLPID